MPEFQHQNSTKWWYHQWLESNILKPRLFVGIIPKTSQTKFHQIRITKSKVIHAQIPVSKCKKQKNGKKISGFQNGAIRGLQIRAAFEISSWSKKITNHGKEISNRAEITNRGKRDFNWGRDYKSGRNYKWVQNMLLNYGT